MTAFVVDRARLPKPWDKPLIFHAENGAVNIEVEVPAEAAIEYQASARIGISRSALELAADVRETFAVLVEAAVNARLVGNGASTLRIVLSAQDFDFR